MTLYLISQVSPIWRTRPRITLQRREKVHIEAWKLYFQERYIWNPYQQLYLFRWAILYLISQIFTEMDKLVSEHARRKRFILNLRACTFRSATFGTSIHDFSFIGERPFTWSTKFLPKCTTWSRNTLRRIDMVHIEALEPVHSGALRMELLSTILAFLVNDPSPNLPNFPGNG